MRVKLIDGPRHRREYDVADDMRVLRVPIAREPMVGVRPFTASGGPPRDGMPPIAVYERHISGSRLMFFVGYER